MVKMDKFLILIMSFVEHPRRVNFGALLARRLIEVKHDAAMERRE